jgi:ferredoxin--NADP+ reductase
MPAMATNTDVPGVPELAPAQMLLVPANAPVTARVVENRRCTASQKAAGVVRHVAFDISGTPLANNFIAGQSFGVLPPGVDAKGQPHKLRLYSVASPRQGEDGKGTVIATTVKRLVDENWETQKLHLGVCSNYLCDLRVGDEVRLSGPNGKRFVLPLDVNAHDYVFFATGTGIAPFRGMLMELAHAGFGVNPTQGASGRAILVLGAAYATDLSYHAELTRWASEYPWFEYVTAISRERNTEGGPAYVQDRIVRDQSVARLLEGPRTLAYVCGIAGMELGIFQKMATALSANGCSQYLGLEGAPDPSAWDRRMIPRQIKPTRRVFLEVY